MHIKIEGHRKDHNQVSTNIDKNPLKKDYLANKPSVFHL